MSQAPNNTATPPLDQQVRFWNDWNADHRFGEIDGFMERQTEIALQAAHILRPTAILELGCGSGWLTNRLSAVAPTTGIDLSPVSIEKARRRYPHCTFHVGDVLEIDLPHVDFIVSCDVLAHVADQNRFVARCAETLCEGGKMMIQTQNPFVWNRNSSLRPQGAGQIRQWLGRGQLFRLLDSYFTEIAFTTIFPTGDKGVLSVTNSWITNGILRRLCGGNEEMNRLKETMGLGQEIVVTATRRP